jgi:hypothetical protein
VAEELDFDGGGSGVTRYEALSDAALIHAMRARDERAVAEFVRRHQFLVLMQARRFRIPLADRRAWIAEALDALAESLMRKRSTIPLSLPRYVVAATKRRALAGRRDLALRERRESEALGELGGLGEGAVVVLCSEDSVRNTYGPAWEAASLPPVLECLLSVFTEGVTPEERELLSWVGQRIPYSRIAEWLGVTRSAAVKRVTRLRKRLVEAALNFGRSLEADQRTELLRFLRRARALDDATLEGLAGIENRDGPR